MIVYIRWPDNLGVSSQVYIIFGGSGFMMHNWPHMKTGKTGRHGKGRRYTFNSYD